MARALRDVLEDEQGGEIRVEVREVGQGGIEGWLGWITQRMGRGKAKGEGLGRWIRRAGIDVLGSSGWPQLRRLVALTLEEARPEVVVFFHPAVGLALQERVQDRSEAGFQRVGVVLEAEELPGWDGVAADLLWVADEGSAKELKEKNTKAKEVVAGGWPVRPTFEPAEERKRGPGKNREPFRILYLINSRRRKAVRTVEKILSFPDVEVTAVVGKEEDLKGDLRKAFSETQGKLEIHEIGRAHV